MFRNLFDGPHLLIVLLVILVLFGGKKLPDAARGLGRSLRIFKSEVKQMRDDDDDPNTPAPPLEGRVMGDERATTPGSAAPRTPAARSRARRPRPRGQQYQQGVIHRVDHPTQGTQQRWTLQRVHSSCHQTLRVSRANPSAR